MIAFYPSFKKIRSEGYTEWLARQHLEEVALLADEPKLGARDAATARPW